MADNNIFQQYLRPPKSVMEYTAEYDAGDARKQALRQNALELAAGQQKYSDGVQSRQRAEQLRQALIGLPQGATDDQRIQAMRGTASPEGFAAADALDKSLIERRKGTAAANKDDAETAKTKLAQSMALHNFQSQKLATVQSLEDALAWADESHGLGLFSQPGQYEQGIARIQQAASNPQAFAQWKAAAMQGGQSVTDQLRQQLEQIKQQEQVRQFGITDQRIKSEGDANRGVTIRGQNKVDERMREANGPGGKPPPGYRWKPDGSLEAIPGGPVASKTTDQQTKLADAQTVLGLLDLAEPLLDQSTQGYVGMGVDMAARAMGKSTSGAEAASELRALEGALISKMPKMSGPQSDKDVLLYRQMAGQIGDPTLPAQTKRAAMRTIRNINQRYIDSTGTAAQAKPTLPQGWSVEVK